jgi:hypothetical protein
MHALCFNNSSLVSLFSICSIGLLGSLFTPNMLAPTKVASISEDELLSFLRLEMISF